MSNPYESPAIVTSELLPDARIWRRVWWPAVVLVAMCVVQLLWCTLIVVVIGVALLRQPEEAEWFIRSLGTNFLWQVSISMAGSLVILSGAWQARRLRSLTGSRVAAALACIPLLTPLFVGGLPFGLWLLLELFKRETVAEFRRLALARSSVPTKRLPES